MKQKPVPPQSKRKTKHFLPTILFIVIVIGAIIVLTLYSSIIVQFLIQPLWLGVAVIIAPPLAIISICVAFLLSNSNDKIKRIAKIILYLSVLSLAIVVIGASVLAILPTSTQQLPYIYHGHGSSIGELAWSADGKRITSWSSDSTVQTWDAFTGNNVQVRHYHDAFLLGNVSEIPSPNGKYIASWIQTPVVAQLDKIIVWDVATGKDLVKYEAPEIGYVAWSFDSRYIASSSNMDINVWESTTGKRIITYEGHNDELHCHHCTTVASLAWSPDGRQIASIDLEGKVLIWDVATGQTYLTYNCHCDPVGITWLLSDESRIIVGSRESASNEPPYHGVIQLLQLAFTGITIDITKQATIICPSNPHSGAVIWEMSPNNKYLAYACIGTPQVNIWDMTTMRVVFTYKGHTGEVYTIAWSPNGRYIATGGADTTVQVWQIN